MEVVRSSVLCTWLAPLWHWLRERYEYSLLAKILRGIALGWRRAYHSSAVVGFLSREGVLTRAWPESVLCRVLTFLISIPTILLQKLYAVGQDVFEHSVFARIAFAVVEQTPLAVAWIMVLFLALPFERWNNAYSFAGFALCFVMAWFAGMRKPGFRLDLKFVGPWLVAFAGMTFAAWPLSAYPSLSFRFLLYYITCMLCVVILVSTVESREQLERLLCFTSLSLLIMSLYGIYQRIQGVEVNLSYVDVNVNGDMPGRVMSFFDNPNTFGEVLLLLIPVAVAYLLCTKSWLGRLLGLLSVGTG